MRWAPKNDVKKEARVARGIYLCNGCKQEVPATLPPPPGKRKRVDNVFVDHIIPIVDPEVGFTTWDDFINNLFCEKHNLQVLCLECHLNIKTAEEKRVSNEVRAIQAPIRKEFPRTYYTWSNMNDRCHNPNATGYEYYGGKGIEVCSAWRRASDNPEAILNFIRDMGHRPEDKTLDRLDYTKGYYPENCRWATASEQARNTSTNNWLYYNGEYKILQEWGEELGIIPNTILTRLRRGWSVEEAFEKVPREKEDYVGRLTQDDFLFISENIGKISQVKIGEILEIDSSQISRVIKRFNLDPRSKKKNVQK